MKTAEVQNKSRLKRFFRGFSANMKFMETIILDLDTGIDDALALAAALANTERVNIAGISATFGNVSTRTSVRNTCAILHHFSRHGYPRGYGKGRL